MLLMSVDCVSQVMLGKNVYINYYVMMMFLGGVQIDDGVMLGLEVGFFIVNYEFSNLYMIMIKLIYIEKGVWLGVWVSVLLGVMIG